MDTASAAQLIILIVKGYLVLGLIFAIPFNVLGIHRVDPSAQNSSIAFRIIMLPGAMLFWPLLLSRLLTKQKKPVECNAHRRCGLTHIQKTLTKVRKQ